MKTTGKRLPEMERVPEIGAIRPRMLKAEFLKERTCATVGTWTRKPWRKWFKNLLARVICAYAPTLDGKWAVANLESWFRPEAPKPKRRPEQAARFWGHAAALVDYYRERFLKQSQSGGQEEDDELAALMRELPDGLTLLRDEALKLPFHERATFMRNFADAYGKTVTPLGELIGATDATGIHKYLLAWFLISLGLERQPRTVRELLQWTWHRNPKLRPPVRSDGRDPWELEIARVQKVFQRLGFSLGGRAQKPRKQRTK